MEPEAAVAIVQAGASPGSILLIRRAERETDSWSGHWSLPGGRRDPEDPDSLHTALRELFEECGIELTRAHMQSALAHTVARRQAPPYLQVAPFLFRIDCELPTTLDPREAVSSVWLPVTALLDPARHALCAVPGRPASMLFPCVDVNGYPLWGFTYRLLMDWLEIRPPQNSGFQGAHAVLAFLTSAGMRLQRDWKDRTALLQGPIPAAAVLAEFSRPGTDASALNCLDVTPERVRILGPEWEEYLIISDTSGSLCTPPA